MGLVCTRVGSRSHIITMKFDRPASYYHSMDDYNRLLFENCYYYENRIKDQNNEKQIKK